MVYTPKTFTTSVTAADLTDMSTELGVLTGRGELAYAQILTSPALVASSGSGAAVTGLSIAVPTSARAVIIEANVGLLHDGSSGGHTIQIVNGAGTILQQADVITVGGPLDYVQVPLLQVRLAPSTAGATYTVRAYGSTTANINVNLTPAYIRAEAI